MPIVPVAGLFETHLTVLVLERSIGFYRDVVGLPLARRVPDRGAAFHWIGGPGQAMLGLWSIGTSPLHLRLHTAFRVSLADAVAAIPALKRAGITPRAGDGREIAEPMVLGWMPAATVYFDDPDGHSLEYLAMLDAPPRPDLGILPLSTWRATISPPRA